VYMTRDNPHVILTFVSPITLFSLPPGVLIQSSLALT
jgi:hypothetical protein